MQVSERELSGVLRTVGGVLLATGALVLLMRKSGPDGWSDFARLLVVLIPAVVLFIVALSPRSLEQARPWQSALIVAAVLLTPVVLYEFLNWIGASTRHSLYNAAVFAVTSILAGYAAARARASYAALLAALAFLATWLFVWDKLLGHPSANTFRWLLVGVAVLLLLAGVRMLRTAALGAGEIATVGGLAGVAAGVLGVVVGGVVGAFRGISNGLVSASSGATSSSDHLGVHEHRVSSSHVQAIEGGTTTASRSLPVHTSGLQHAGWDIYLLVVSLALLWLAARTRARGIGYVGALGVGAFIISVGVQITRLQSGRLPTHDVLAWPLILVALGAVALAASLLRSREADGES